MVENVAGAAEGRDVGKVECNQGTLLNNWNKLDWQFCNPLAMKVLERFA